MAEGDEDLRFGESDSVGILLRTLMEDPEFRRSFNDDPAEALSSRGMGLPSGVEVRLFENTDETMHVILPPDPNAELSDEMLHMVAGGKTASTIGSVGSGGSVACVCGTLSTASSASSAGSIGSSS